MNIEEVTAEINKTIQKVNLKLIPLSAFEFGNPILRDDIKIIPVEADNDFGMSAIQVWQLIETYTVNEDGSLTKQDIT